MKIYILPYTNKTFFSFEKRVSGIDAAALTQFQTLSELGHDVHMWAAQGNLHKYFKNIDHYGNAEENESAKEFESRNRNKILQAMLKSITEFNPDIILSNYEFNQFYERLIDLDIPIIHNSHSMPGFWTDLANANLMYKFTEIGNSLCCVSNIHKEYTEKYYRAQRKDWNFESISVDSILYPQYCKKEIIVAGNRNVKHVSVASKKKDTFLIHKFLYDTDIPSEVFTTLTYMGSGDNEDYVNESIKNFSGELRKTHFDIDHKIIMEEISEAGCVFVGNAPDTFTITSLEALSRGIPLIVKGINGKHPAQEMVDDECKQYVYIYNNQKDYISKVKEFIMLNLDDRNKIAESVNRKMGKEIYMQSIEKVIKDAIHKYKRNENKRNSMEIFG